MSAQRLRLSDFKAGLHVEIRVDDDFPAREYPVEMWLGDDPLGYGAMTPDAAERVERALIAAAEEAREHVATSDRVPRLGTEDPSPEGP